MADVIQEIKDANGKTFPVDVSKICDINGDLGDKASASITDGVQNRVAHVHDVVYVNQKGEVIDNMKLLQDMAAGKVHIAALDVEMEATHSGKNHNYCIYYEDSMEKDAESFVNPFKKPMLKNHDSYSEPLGRITQAWYGPSELTDERSTIHLKTRVTDQDAIPKFLDGRYGTVSIGGTMGTVTCNICGKTILKDGKFKFCGHWRGESYKDEVCYWGARDITYHEVSTVNNPADDFAQIMKVTVVTDSDDKKDSKEDTTMAGTNTDSNHVDALKQISDMIDSILNPTAPSASDSNGTPEAPEAKDGEAAPQEGGEPKADAATDELEKTKKELADAQEKVTALETELQETKDALAKAQEDLTAATTDAAQFKEKCVTLATANKELVADGIIAKEIEAGKLQEDAKDDRKKELVAMSMKDLNKLAEEEVAKDAATPRTPAQVTNPTLANPETKDSNGSADANKKTTDDNRAKKTVDDFAKDIVSKLVK
jgi:hypothetical protein